MAGPMVERVRPQMRQLVARLSDSERAHIVKERREGATLPSLMKKYSLSSYSLRLIFAEGGIPPHLSSLTREQRKSIGEAAIAGRTVMETARLIKLPQSTVRLYFAYCRATG